MIDGEWHLVASASIKTEVSFINGEPDPDGVANWLNGFDDQLIENAKPTSGLVLSINPDGSFTERVSGNPEVYWFDTEGILTDEVMPFNGTTFKSELGAYIRPLSIPRWATPVEGRYGKCVLRHDDGDTKITDNLRVIDEHLIRTVNVVTDELYLDRIVIKYKRVK